MSKLGTGGKSKEASPQVLLSVKRKKRQTKGTKNNDALFLESGGRVQEWGSGATLDSVESYTRRNRPRPARECWGTIGGGRHRKKGKHPRRDHTLYRREELSTTSKL